MSLDKDKALWSHVLPFAAWIIIMAVLGEPAGWKYAARVVVSLALLLALKPWRWYAPTQLRNVPLAVLVGIVVFILWILIPVGVVRESSNVYDPAVNGWLWTSIRLLGSAFVISVIEEFFWRGFVYRWLIKKDFLSVDLGFFHAGFFALTCLLFGLEHKEWLSGILAGAVYGALLIKTRDIWAACIAHAVTNLLLGVYVLATARYYFW